MHKISLLAIAACLTATTAIAQKKTNKAHVKWGPDMSVKENNVFDQVVGDVGNSTFMLMRHRKDLLIQRMDGLKVAWQKPVDLEMGKTDLDLHSIIVSKDEILVFATHYDKKQDEYTLYLNSYGQDGFSPRKRFEKVADIHSDKSRNKGAFNVSTSPDRTKVLVRVDPPFEKGEDEEFRLNVYDAGMNPQWSQDFKLPFKDDLFGMESQRVDNDGSVLMLGVKYTEKQEKRERKRADKATYDYHLLVYTGDSPVAQDHPITVADKFLQDMTISMAKEGDIICAGLFGNKGSFSVRGAFFLRLDRATKEILHQSYKDFSDDFITSYMSEKQVKKAKKKAARKDEELELPEFQLHDIIHREDGGAVLVAEQYKVYTVCYTDSKGNTRCNTHYEYNDVIVVNINPEGDIEWASKVPKRQHTVNDGGMYSGCAVEVKDNKIYLVFNDSGANLFVKQGDKIKQFKLKGKDALVVLATIDGDGNVSREALFSPERRDVILRPKDCVELKNEDMFIYASRKRDYRFGMLEFK